MSAQTATIRKTKIAHNAIQNASLALAVIQTTGAVLVQKDILNWELVALPLVQLAFMETLLHSLASLAIQLAPNVLDQPIANAQLVISPITTCWEKLSVVEQRVLSISSSTRSL